MPVSYSKPLVRFGVFELDLEAKQLHRNGVRIRLPRQPLELLSVLLERPGEVVTREELRRRLWAPEVFVDFEHGLNKSVQKLREALGDSADLPRYIETIQRTGYRFIAPVDRGPNHSTEPRSTELEEVEAARARPEPPTPVEKATVAVQPASRAGRQRLLWWLAAGVGAVLLAIAVFWLVRKRLPLASALMTGAA